MSSVVSPSSAKVDLSNWCTAPFNRWAFQHVPEIISSAIIPRASDDVLPLPIKARSLEGFSIAMGGVPINLNQFQATTATDAMVVLLNGEIVYEFYDHDMGPRTPHILMSASKSVIGLAAGILHHSGLLDLDAPVSDLVPEIVGSAYRRATVRQLLDMRTGVVLDEQDVIAYEAASNWSPPPPGREGANLHDFLRNLTTPAQPHGGPFRYISGNIDLLGWVIERATGQTVAEVVSERLWRPMGAQDDAFITLDRAGAPRCTGGVCATARDFARIGQLIVQGGRRGDRRIIPEAWIDDIVENGDRQAWKAGEFSAGFAGMTMAYRGGWYVIDDAPKMIFAMGIHGQNLFVDRAHGLVIAKLSSQADRIGYRAVALTHRAAPEILRCLML